MTNTQTQTAAKTITLATVATALTSALRNLTADTMELLTGIATDLELFEAEHEALRTLGFYCNAKGYNKHEVYKEELSRIGSRNPISLDEYLHMNRAGSHHCLTRKVRRAIWCNMMIRRELNTRPSTRKTMGSIL